MAEQLITGIKTKDGIAKISYEAIVGVPDVSEQINAALASLPKHTWGTEDLTAGESELATGTFYYVYE